VVDPFTADCEWLRCALHAHTTESDGELSPALLAAHYARAGFDVLAITDHWKIAAAEVHGIIVVPSIELNCVLPGARDGHVLGFGVVAGAGELRDLALGYPELGEIGEWITSRGGVAYLAHPYWSGVTPGTLELAESVTGIEVYNAGCQLEVGRGLSTVHWDELLEGGGSAPHLRRTTRTIPASTPGSRGPGSASPSGPATACWLRSGTARCTRLRGLRSTTCDGTGRRSR
jgi:hypothetical protein